MHFLCNAIALSLTAALLGAPALAQNFPGKPFRILTANPGVASDIISRVAAQGLTARLGQPAVVINRPGSTIAPITEVVSAAPDGYTLLCTAQQFWLLNFLRDDI